jgi:glutathione S-transferase
MTRVYGMSGSGNCHKVRMVLDALRQPYEWKETNPKKGDTRTPSFLAMNPNGQVPAVMLDDGTALTESNAIMFYFAEGTALIPDTRLGRARMLQWLFFEQYSHEPYIAVARALRKFHPDPESQRAVIESKMAGGYHALEIMEGRLASSPFFAGDGFSIADIGLYAYTHVADEGGFDLDRFPAVRAWLARVQAQPGCTRMT